MAQSQKTAFTHTNRIGLEHQNHPKKPTYSLSTEEEIFGLLISNERYKDF
jgi:hypothetical protein